MSVCHRGVAPPHHLQHVFLAESHAAPRAVTGRPSVQPQPLNGSCRAVGLLEISADQVAVTQRGRQALVPQQPPHLVEPDPAAQPARGRGAASDPLAEQERLRCPAQWVSVWFFGEFGRSRNCETP